MGGPGRQSAWASPGAHGAEPMKEGLPSPSPRLLPRRVTLVGGLSQTQLLLCPPRNLHLPKPRSGKRAAGAGGGAYSAPLATWGELPGFPGGAVRRPAPPPSRPREGHRWGRKAKVSLTLGAGRRRRGSWPGSTPTPAPMSFGAANSPVESVSHGGWKYRAPSPLSSPPPLLPLAARPALGSA